jgi:hypothetical protein
VKARRNFHQITLDFPIEENPHSEELIRSENVDVAATNFAKRTMKKRD